jgi:hypothetical protein
MQALTKIARNIYSVSQARQAMPTARKRLYSQKQNLIGKFKTTEIELFRIQNGPSTKLREFAAQQRKNSKSYDLVAQPDGLIHPKTSEFFEGPNGSSLRPIGPVIFEVVSHWRGKDARIYRIPKGTKLPDNLILLHEHSDHYSLQTTEPVKLSELNKRLTVFFNQFEYMNPNEFQSKYSYTDAVHNQK